ncbi:glucose-6-phosphate dehydrogenase [Acididesulfobacillus acetoxydans]|uniref:Glucose-6-phosphate 1-dehydrogenase n=1 Tax=Acididesulfobacillus acetoxydans TaxID=1561005 RepID=A0A8S0W2A4_9FIRM|nr:glucose-6-phosphate dehydrogenase [Acididesulfobacillus acetoxydans]CAA7600548.1 glucose-6-phosphate dehydrogenase [Acididesulfobacillus acetoxydans]CEJ06682.1 Glucose-6-phosphate 1-dehydrogenase [Acididesulfobacillus acetoxydans]
MAGLQPVEAVLVIFGGTGDLTSRKLIPALHNLKAKDSLPQHFAVIGVGRRQLSDQEFRKNLYPALRQAVGENLRADTWAELQERIFYRRFDFQDERGYRVLREFLEQTDAAYQTGGNRIYYLAVAPEYFGVIVEKLYANGLVRNRSGQGWQRVVIEKPFGRDLATARVLNRKITAVFSEKNTFRIDHYLGKEMIQNIMVLRFANPLFEAVWNNKYVDNVQISATETVGVENRAGYYEQAGALRDMLQNHLLQLLTLTGMEPPVSLTTEAVRDEKVKVLRSLRALAPERVAGDVVRGQYGPGRIEGGQVAAYREEKGISPSSDTETFLALKVEIDNFRWAGVPFYIRTGKRLRAKSTDVIVQFKALPPILYVKEHGELEPNILIIRIQPKEGVYFQFNAKKPGMDPSISPVKMDFCQNCDFENNSPEAYEKLLLDVMRGDPTLFTRWDEVEYSWKFVDQIAQTWGEDQRISSPVPYPAGTWGPAAAGELLARDGRAWWSPGG